MGDDGETLASKRWQGKDTSHRREFLPAMATYDACLAEQSLYGRVAGGDGSCMARCRPTATLTASRLDGGDAASLADEAASMVQQFVRIGDILDIE